MIKILYFPLNSLYFFYFFLNSLLFFLKFTIFLKFSLFFLKGLSLCNISPESPLKANTPLAKFDSPHLSKHQENSPDLKSSDKSFSRNKIYSKKAPARSFMNKDSKSRTFKIVSKKPKENFEKEALPAENSPKQTQKKDFNLQFSTLLDAKKISSMDKIADSEEMKIKDSENPSLNNNDSPLTSHNNSFRKSLSPEIKDYTLSSSAMKTMKKGFSVKNLEIIDSKEKKENIPSNINTITTNSNINSNINGNINSNNINSNNINSNINANANINGTINNGTINGNINGNANSNINTISNINNNNANNIKSIELKKNEEKSAKIIQHYYRKMLARQEKKKRNNMLNQDIIEISRNPLHFLNPRRPCDYQIVICKDPNDVLNAILFIQAFWRKLLNYRRKYSKKSENESLNDAQISVNCEESNLDSIKSMSFLDQVNNEELAEKGFKKKAKNNDFVSEVI